MSKVLVKAIFTGLFILTSATAISKTLTTYEEIANTLSVGNTVVLSFKPEKCKVTPERSNAERSDRLTIKLNDLYEWHSAHAGSKGMRVLGSEDGGLFGDKKFHFYRNMTMVFEDGTVMVLADHVNPITYDLDSREQMICRLSEDGSGGVIANRKI